MKTILFSLFCVLTAVSVLPPVDAMSAKMRAGLSKAHSNLKTAHKKAASLATAAAKKAKAVGDVVSEKAHKASASFHKKAEGTIHSLSQGVAKFHEKNGTPEVDDDGNSVDAGDDAEGDE